MARLGATRERKQVTRLRMLEEIVGPGLVGGWVAGLLMLVVAMIHAALVGRGAVWPLQMLATSLLGAGALEGGPGVSLLGLGIHLAISGIWGVLFNSIVPRGVAIRRAALLGLAFGVLVYLFMTWLVLPWIVPGLFHALHPAVPLAYHLLFGAALTLAVVLRREITELDDARARGETGRPHHHHHAEV